MMETTRENLAVYVNDHRVRIRPGRTLRDAVRTYDFVLLKALDGSNAEIVDAHGWPARLDAPPSPDERFYVCLLPWAF